MLFCSVSVDSLQKPSRIVSRNCHHSVPFQEPLRALWSVTIGQTNRYCRICHAAKYNTATLTFISMLEPEAISVSVEFRNIKPWYHPTTGAGNPAARHCRVIDWPTASDTSRYGPNVIDGASAMCTDVYQT